MGIASSLSNLELVREFCGRHLPRDIYHFTCEDLLYTSDTLKPSLLAFLTELLVYFVLNPLDIVKPRISPTSKAGETVH